MDYTTRGKFFYPNYNANIKFCYDEDFQNQGAMGCRYQIILIEKGCGFVKIGDTRSIIMPPMICCINEKERVEIEKSTDIKAMSLYFSPDIVNINLNFDNMNDGVVTFSDRWYLRPFFLHDLNYQGIFLVDDSISKHLSQMLTGIGKELDLQPDDSWPCRSRAYLMELLIFLSKIYDRRNYDPIFQITDTSNEVDQILLFLHTNYRNKITLQKLSQDFHTNRTTLNLEFKKTTGVTVMNYLYKLRITIACSLLRNTMLSINEILTIVGFKDDAHFGRIFKKQINCSPSEYREKNCWMLH